MIKVNNEKLIKAQLLLFYLNQPFHLNANVKAQQFKFVKNADGSFSILTGASNYTAKYAKSSGATMIDNTMIGKVASNAVTKGADFERTWSQASAAFCNQAHGVVNAFVSTGAYRGPESIFWSVEIPTLLNNPRVEEIIIHIFE